MVACISGHATAVGSSGRLITATSLVELAVRCCLLIIEIQTYLQQIKQQLFMDHTSAATGLYRRPIAKAATGPLRRRSSDLLTAA